MGTASTLTFTLNNPNGAGLTNANFTDALGNAGVAATSRNNGVFRYHMGADI